MPRQHTYDKCPPLSDNARALQSNSRPDRDNFLSLHFSFSRTPGNRCPHTLSYR